MASSFSQGRGEEIWRLFNEVAGLDPDAREARLDAACRDDPELRREVESLLAADVQADAILGAYEEPLQAQRALAGALLDGVPTDPHQLVGRTVSHYRIEGYLGGGGMGVVYRAEDTRLQRPVALKFLPPELSRDAEAKARFLHEARAASALDHVNIATVHEIGEMEGGQLFIVMTCYAGETLKAKIARGLLEVEEAVGYAVQMAEGLSRAHEAGIVHRDVKPANVLVTERGRVKLVDFGLAKVAEVSLTKTGTTLGTVSYMSPEQARGESVDHRTDLWSLGVVLYEMLTGERPFGGEQAAAVLYGIRHDVPKSPAALRPGVPAELAQVVEKLLRKDADERYPRAEALLADLRTLQRERETSQPVAGRAASLSRRRRLVRYGSVAALVLVLAGLGYLLGRRELGKEASSSPVPVKDRPSIAVLPLESRSGEEEQAYFADGMTDELTAVLTKIAGLRVVPRPSVMHFKASGQPLTELAQRLQVGYFIDGSVLWAGEEVRITLNLIDPATETDLWGRSFVGAQREVLALQQEVARAVVQEVAVQLTPADEARLGRAREVNPRAYELYRQGWHVLDRPGEPHGIRVQKAVPYFEQAIAIDSTYAEAYARLGSAYVLLGHFRVLPWEEAIPQAERYLEKAMALDDALPIAYVAKSILLQRTGDWAEAEEALRHAIGLDPGYASYRCELALLMFRTGRLEEGLELARYALGLDPVEYFAHLVKVEAQIFLRRYDEAIASSRKLLDLYPGDWIGHWGLGRAYLGKGLYEEALAVFEEMVSRDSIRIGHLGYAYAVMGRREEALKILEALKARRADLPVELDQISRIYTALGEREQALDWLEQTQALFDYFKADPAFDALRTEPRFRAFLKKMGLDP